MPAAITEFVDVNVLVAGAAAEKFSFGNLMGVFEHSVTVNRQDGPYADITAVNAAGFTSAAAPQVNAWATSAFAQDDGVDQVLIGRRIPLAGATAGQVWQVVAVGPVFVEETVAFNDATLADWTILPPVDAVGNYAAIGYPGTFSQISLNAAGGTAGTVGSVTWEYWNGSAWFALAGVTDMTTDFTVAVADDLVVSWVVPLDWAAQSLNSGPSLFYVRAVSDGAYAILPIYDQGFVDGAGDANWTATMDAIELADADSWYITNIESRVNADVEEVSVWTEARTKIFPAQSADLTAVEALAMQAASRNRSSSWFHATSIGSDGYLDGAISSSGGGLNLDAPDGRGTWAFRPLEGVTFDALTGAQATALYAADANIFGRNLGLSFSSKGTMASGRFIDIQTTIDWVQKRIEERILEGFVATPTVVPYTDAGINIVAAWVQEVLDRGVSFGHFSPDTPPVVTVPLASSVSKAVKETRGLTLTATAVFAGGIQQLTLTLNLTF